MPWHSHTHLNYSYLGMSFIAQHVNLLVGYCRQNNGKGMIPRLAQPGT